MAQDPKDKSEYLYIKPVVVPRKAERVGNTGQTDLYFYIVFTFQRRGDVTLTQSTSGDQGLVPLKLPCILNRTLSELESDLWPNLILDYLGKQYLKLHVLGVDSDEVGDAGLEIDVLTPNDLSAEGWNWQKDETIQKAKRLWNSIFAPALRSLERQNQPDAIAARKEEITTCSRKSDLTAVYMQPPKTEQPVGPQIGPRADQQPGQQVKANPKAASDLRPGFRLESVDHRELAQAFQEAQRHAAAQQAPAAAGNAEAANRLAAGAAAQQPSLDTLGVQLIIGLGYSNTDKLGESRTS
jgi:hypothetical protein